MNKIALAKAMAALLAVILVIGGWLFLVKWVEANYGEAASVVVGMGVIGIPALLWFFYWIFDEQ